MFHGICYLRDCFSFIVTYVSVCGYVHMWVLMSKES